MLGKSSLILLALAGLLVAQPNFPKFEDYPVKEIFKGTPATPILATKRQRLFRTRIREAAARGPNFAGHYAIADWGCGSDCAGTAMVDVKTGQTFDLPFRTIEYAFVDFAEDPQMKDMNFGTRLNSRLLILQGCPDGKGCGSYYMEWSGSQFETICTMPPTGPPIWLERLARPGSPKLPEATCTSSNARRN